MLPACHGEDSLCACGVQVTVVFLADVHSVLADSWPRLWEEQETWLQAKDKHEKAKKVWRRSHASLHPPALAHCVSCVPVLSVCCLCSLAE